MSRPPHVVARTTINRNEAYANLTGRELTLVIPPKLEAALETGKPPVGTKGKSKGKPVMSDDPYLTLDKQIRVPYMTVGTDKKPSEAKTFPFQRTTLFTSTTKMSAASWSIPAGPPAPATKGTCQAADLFKNPAMYQRLLEPFGERVSQGAPDKSSWICAYCYAGKSNYMYRNSQYAQTAHNIWMTLMIQTHGVDHAAGEMSRALRAHLLNRKKRESMGDNPSFFRIHDSGDFTLVPNTWELWCLVARELSNVSFWAPTRMWMMPAFRRQMKELPPPPNLTVRPSALHFDDQAPSIEGFHAGSTAHTHGSKKKVDPVAEGIADWRCPAYDGMTKKHSCAGSTGPEGENSCRVCWTYQGTSVSYRSH